VSAISNEAGRCQEVSLSFFASVNPLLFSIEHTRALAQERPFPRRIFFRRRSLSVSPYALSPVFLHPFGAAHQTSLRSWRIMMRYSNSLAIQGGRVA
jgi:hypothetical protein